MSRKFIFTGIALFAFFSYLSAQHSFLKTQGTAIVKSNSGDTLLLKGVCFGNEVWHNTDISQNHHSEEDYQRIKSWGMNCIRFYLNYAFFEDDQHPFEYKEQAWEWLDQNLQWAKKHSIYLILNMHVPQGGFQSNAGGHALWEDPLNRRRLASLWKAIAARYKDEDYIAGYDLLNEPGVNRKKEQWQSLAQTLSDEIRTVDKNHILFVENVNSIAGRWTKDSTLNFINIDDPNWAYTFHFYSPIEFTHQSTPWTGLGEGGNYPDASLLAFPDDIRWYSKCFTCPEVRDGTTNWKYYESDKIHMNDDYIHFAKPVISMKALNEGKVMLGPLTVKEYNEDKKYVRDIVSVGPFEKGEWKLWSKDNTGSVNKIYKGGIDRTNIIVVSGVENDGTLYNNSLRFPVKENHYYTVGAYIKGERIGSESNVKLTFDYEYSPSDKTAFPRNKELLKNLINQYYLFAEKNNRPLLCGEFGAYKECFKGNTGGLRWVNDVLDIFLSLNLHFTYHAYHEDAFGIFDEGGELPSTKNCNKKLIKLFVEKLSQ